MPPSTPQSVMIYIQNSFHTVNWASWQIEIVGRNLAPAVDGDFIRSGDYTSADCRDSRSLSYTCR